MVQLSPFAMRTAMRLDELGEEGQRAAYMVIEEMHRLQDALKAEQEKNPLNINNITQKSKPQQKRKGE